MGQYSYAPFLFRTDDLRATGGYGGSYTMSSGGRYGSPEKRIEPLVPQSPYQSSPLRSTFNPHQSGRPSYGGGGGYTNPAVNVSGGGGGGLGASGSRGGYNMDALGPQAPYHAFVRSS